MNRSRVTKLERQIRGRPCPKCGLVPEPVSGDGAEADWDRLSRAEQQELATLVRAATGPPCLACGRTRPELTGLTDAQLDRMGALLGVAPA